jgi:hypothetical protein
MSEWLTQIPSLLQNSPAEDRHEKRWRPSKNLAVFEARQKSTKDANKTRRPPHLSLAVFAQSAAALLRRNTPSPPKAATASGG